MISTSCNESGKVLGLYRTFTVVVLMRIVVAADLLAVLVVSVALVEGCTDGARGVGEATASGGGLAFDELGWGCRWGGDGADCEEQSGGDEGCELHFENRLYVCSRSEGCWSEWRVCLGWSALAGRPEDVWVKYLLLVFYEGC